MKIQSLPALVMVLALAAVAWFAVGEIESAHAAAGSKGVQGAHLRIARPTDNLDPVVAFYRDGLGFELLTSFEDHDGFDGVMLGHPGAGYHIELTHERGHRAGRAPNEEHLMVFYLPDEADWQAAVDRLVAAGHAAVEPNNPYWNRQAKTFEDPDGYRVILARYAWR